jgi:site-specific DNA-cytosine methylase
MSHEWTSLQDWASLQDWPHCRAGFPTDIPCEMDGHMSHEWTSLEDWTSLQTSLRFRAGPHCGLYFAPGRDVTSGLATCAGNNLHPSGTRTLTIRELALLQTFPPDCGLPGVAMTELRKMIGST